MMKHMVIVKHPACGGHFLFLVPETVNEKLRAGQLVLCNTKRGEDFGVCMGDSFNANPETMCKLFNTNPKNMKYVVAKFDMIRFEMAEEKMNEDGQQNERGTF